MSIMAVGCQRSVVSCQKNGNQQSAVSSRERGGTLPKNPLLLIPESRKPIATIAVSNQPSAVGKEGILYQKPLLLIAESRKPKATIAVSNQPSVVSYQLSVVSRRGWETSPAGPGGLRSGSGVPSYLYGINVLF